MCEALGDVPHVPLQGHPAQPQQLLAAASAAGIDSFEVCLYCQTLILRGA